MTKKQLKHKGEIMLQSYDEAFKIMYGNPENIEVTTLLVSKLLNIDYKELEGNVEILLPKTPNELIGEKLSERDVVVKVDTTNKYKLVIEVNVREKAYRNILDRNLYYLSEVFSKGLKQKSNYEELVSTYLINLNTFVVSKENKVIDEYLLRNEEGEVYSDKIKILCINLEECLKLWYNKKYEEERYKEYRDIILLCASMRVNNMNEYEKIINEIEVNNKVKGIMKGVTYKMNNDDELWTRYISKEEDEKMILNGIIEEERETSHAKGKEEGIKQGILKGTLQTKKDMVINMYKDKISLEKISQYVKLPIEEIEEIIKENGK